MPLLRQVVLVEDRLDGTDRLAGATVDALVGMNVEHPTTLIDAVDRTLLHTRPILQVDARKRDHISHARSLHNNYL